MVQLYKHPILLLLEGRGIIGGAERREAVICCVGKVLFVHQQYCHAVKVKAGYQASTGVLDLIQHIV